MTRAQSTPMGRAPAAAGDRGGEAGETRLPMSATPQVRSRFELAAARMADAWLRAGQVCVSVQEFRVVREFLERDGWTVEDLPGGVLRLRCRGVLFNAMTREAAALVALRRLVALG